MPSSFDLTVYPLVRQAAQDQDEWPGLHVAETPRRPTRSRAGDRLILYLCLDGNAPLSSGKLEQVLEKLGKTFYDTSGSVTAALRSVAESLNSILLERNLRNTNTSRQEVGLLTLIALRGDQLYLTQSGPVHAYIVAGGRPQHLYDPETSGRGLGMSRATTLRYFHTSLQAGDTLLLACQPSPAWSAGALSGLSGQAPESLSRQLLAPDTPDVNGVLIQVRSGLGKVHSLKTPLPGSAGDRAPSSPPAAAPNWRSGGLPPTRPAGQPLIQAPERKAPAPANKAPSSELTSASAAAQVFDKGQPDLKSTPDTASQREIPLGQARPVAAAVTLEPAKRIRRSAGSTIGTAFRRVGQGLKSLLLRMLPDETLFTIPNSTMAFIAIAVPLMIVAAASMVYLQRGRASLYGALFTQASQSAAAAISQADPQAQREGWLTALQYLDVAETYRITTESQALRVQGRTALDALNLVRRIDFQPAILNGLPENVLISRMVLSGGDLYMLDSRSGNILHGEDTVGRGFELDSDFHCGSGNYGNVVVGPLIDLAPAPQGSSPELAVIALDDAGNLLTCNVNDPPEALALAPPATAENWGNNNITGFIIDHDLGHLYVLDPANRAVWAYWSGQYTETPQLFFDEQTPELQDVTDLTANHDELYLLHANGGMTLCIFSGLSGVPTRCSDVPYVDYRPGLENTPLAVQSPFQQVMFSLPPNPSLYLLEPQGQAVYHFSLRTLGFQRQYLPARTLSANPATAFTVQQVDQTMFLALGNQVFYGSMP